MIGDILHCKYCGNQFKTTRNGHVYCSPKCCEQDRKIKIIKDEIKCQQCNKLFTPKVYNQLYCSNQCRGKSERARSKTINTNSYNEDCPFNVHDVCLKLENCNVKRCWKLYNQKVAA
jgi:hypothetical protein